MIQSEKIRLLVTIAIPTCNRPTALEQCLRSLSSQRFGEGILPQSHYEIIVSDDGDDISATQAVASEVSNVTVVIGPRRGPAANRNFAAAHATGEIVVFVDDDCICSESLVESYLCTAAKNPEVNVFEGRTSAIGAPRSHADSCPVNETGGYLWSCNLAIRKHLFESIGGFDEDFPFAAMEDVDLRERLKARGENIMFLAEAQVHHPWERRRGWIRIKRHRDSLLIFLKKHPSALKDTTISQILKSRARVLFRSIYRGMPRYGLSGASSLLEEMKGDLYIILKLHTPCKGDEFIPRSWRS